MPEEACPGCGLVLPASDGPTHAYIGSSPACWALFGEVIAKEFSDAARATTVADVAAATTAAEHGRLVRRWAEDVWDGWSAHHDTVRTWVRETGVA